MLALTLFNNRRQQHQALTFRLREHVIDHLADGLRGQRDVVVRTTRFADAGVQQSQIVVDFSNGAYRRTRVVGGRFLFDRNRRRQPFDMIDVRFLHQRQELSRVGGERFDVATLAFGVQGVESE